MAIITISRGTFSGGQKLAECLAKKLGYKSISREILVDAAEKYGISEKILIKAMKSKPAIKERLSLNIDRFRYLSFIQATLCEQAKNDNIVYYGHAGHLLLKDACSVIKVKVITTMEQRLAFAMECNKFSREEAATYIKKMDRYRGKWTKFLYNIDWNDPSMYDIIINLEYMTMQTACEIVCTMAKSPEYVLTKEKKEALSDLALESSVKAKLAADKNTKYYMLKISAKGGHVKIYGRVKNIDYANRIKAIVSELPGVKSVDCSCADYYINDNVIVH
jgi:cytidylate kinase